MEIQNKCVTGSMEKEWAQKYMYNITEGGGSALWFTRMYGVYLGIRI